jgi:FAD/FMN-containing dehydrogenase
MLPITRRQFIQQTTFAVATLCASCKAVAAQLVSNGVERNAPAVDSAAVRKLASQLSGRLIATDAPDYETARLVFNRAFDQHPAFIVRCASESDVARTLEFSRKSRLPLAIRAGGHSRAGFGVCEGGVVIDLSGMKRVEIDRGEGVARAAGGALLRDLDQALEPSGMATTTGGCPNVGLAGFTLGGGEGILMSVYGAGCDNLISARVVTPDGRQVDANHGSNPDLFWAIRGGGGNFGVVTSFEYRLHPVGKVLAGALTYSAADRIAELLQSFAKFTEAAPDEMVPLGEFLPSKQGPVFINHVCYVGEARIGNDLLTPLRALKPTNDDMRVVSYFEAQAGGFTPAPAPHFQMNLFLPELNSPVVAAIAAAMSDAPALSRVLIVPFFGAVTRVPVSEMAFAMRQTGYEVDMQCRWGSDADKSAAVSWVKMLKDKLEPFARGLYVNQTTERSPGVAQRAYGSNYARLVEIKKKYDPDNVLRLNQNIQPT